MEIVLLSHTYESRGKMVSTGNGHKVRLVVTHVSVLVPLSYLRKYQTGSEWTIYDRFWAILAKISTFRVKVGVDNLIMRR